MFSSLFLEFLPLCFIVKFICCMLIYSSISQSFFFFCLHFPKNVPRWHLFMQADMVYNCIKRVCNI